ncbi:MAG TPA: aldehyde dehydrogenase family protein [Paraburkholderia sp.]|uniref:aldehyde dehydrogenase family protein n=1 Tax=Paraburkholderia sp. TaxID=1926495 RepID=UPI002B48827F|nr:aldehyde dehydrogenase family protein [Paraburkholderia sp.]HKR44073.1 aldehyde dehydrogenase family protein [Paraburkholderia sp.]
MNMRNELFIDGKWAPAARGGMLEVFNPADGKAFHAIAAASAEDVDRAVIAARRAFDDGVWPRMSGRERAHYLRRIAEVIRGRLPAIAELEVRDNGKPRAEAEWDIGDAAYTFEYYASLAEKFDEERSEAIALPDQRFKTRVVREPVGVVGAIIPWNYPLLMAAWKVAPALAAGCTVVLKPAESTSLTALELAAISEEVDLPPGVLNVVTGLGPDVGQPLVDHPLVDKLAFTGSGAVGSRIMAAAAKDIKRVSLELGGKSPFIVFEDSEIDKAVEWVMFGIFWNQGQVCSATSRVLVHEQIYHKFLERLTAEARKITIGDGLKKGVLLGPLVSDLQHQRVTAAVEKAVAEGATVVTGGGRPKELETGYFFEPTILTDVPLTSSAWTDEIFGPVVCVRPFSSEKDAVALANDTRFGLAAAVMTRDAGRAERVAAALRAGTVWINCSQPSFIEAPWGGYKQSGIGRELGRWGFENYLETKQVTAYVSDDPWGWYIKH